MHKYLKILMMLTMASSISLLMPFAQAADIKDRSFKIAFVQPKDHPQAIALERFAEIVDKRSGGKLKIKVCAGGTLGGDAAVIQSLQGGTIEGTMVATSLLGGQIKEFAVLDFPYLFNDGTEADAVLDGPVGRKLNEKLTSKGLVGISFWEHGFRNMTNSRKPINTLADFQGLKIPGKIYTFFFCISNFFARTWHIKFISSINTSNRTSTLANSCPGAVHSGIASSKNNYSFIFHIDKIIRAF
jgi:TRAP-type C4-dicarboxylate transport system substrate-binding protein